jgi:hypothetical protein
LQWLCRTSRRFNIWVSIVIILFSFSFDFMRFGALFCAARILFLHAAGNGIGDSGCSALAAALTHLSALQHLYLIGNFFFSFCSVCMKIWCCIMRCGTSFSHAADNEIGESGCSALAVALPHLSALQELHLGSNSFISFLFCMDIWGQFHFFVHLCSDCGCTFFSVAIIFTHHHIHSHIYHYQ